MRQITESLNDPADHLALDEAALLLADAGRWGETIRLWEFARPVVVMGRSTKVDYEIRRDYCQQNGIRLLRRCSGGASVLGGPGCLMYSVVLNLSREPGLRQIDVAHRFVMGRVLAAAQEQISEVSLQGTCDLTVNNRKFSGNSLRIARTHLLYHGTILYAADLRLVVNCLANAPRQPDYRDGRSHGDFVTNIDLDPIQFKSSLLREFGVNDEALLDLPSDEMQRLKAERYENPKWHMRH
jgi:lipoate-protein ligase A